MDEHTAKFINIFNSFLKESIKQEFGITDKQFEEISERRKEQNKEVDSIIEEIEKME